MKKITAALLSLIILAGCSKPQAFEFRGIKNINLQQTAFSNTFLSSTLTLFNPNNYDVKVKRIDADMYINNNFIAHYQLDTLLSVPGNSLFDFNANVNVNTAKVLGNALSSLFNQQILIQITGTAKVGRGMFFINVPFNVSTKQNLRF